MTQHLAQHNAMVADPRRAVVATRTDGPPEEEGVHKIVVVGGGAAGLELVTRLGDRLGRRPSSSKVAARCTSLAARSSPIISPKR